MTETEIRTRLRDWILDRSNAPPGTELNDDTLILESGLLSSLDVVELVLFVENLNGLHQFRRIGSPMRPTRRN